MTKTEYETCQKNGVSQVTEIKIGFDGIVVAAKKGAAKADFTIEQIWLGLARQVPRNGQLVANPYQRWNEVDASLPNWPIEVMGPPPTSGTRDAFVELVMDVGCKNFAEIKAVSDAKARAQACSAIREDGKFIEAGENDNLIVQRLATEAGRQGSPRQGQLTSAAGDERLIGLSFGRREFGRRRRGRQDTRDEEGLAAQLQRERGRTGMAGAKRRDHRFGRRIGLVHEDPSDLRRQVADLHRAQAGPLPAQIPPVL